MGMALFGIGSNILSAKKAGEVWSPKSQRLNVGRELCPISATAFTEQERTVTVAGGDDVRFMSRDLYGFAKAAAKSGQAVKNFRRLDTKEFSFSSTQSPTASPEEIERATQKNLNLVTSRDSLFDNDEWSVFFSDNTLHVYAKEKDENGNMVSKLVARHAVTGDCRLVWDKNNKPQILSGSRSLTAGKLKATGVGEILIRTSGVDVEAGENSVVLNLSDKSGTFSGGRNVTYRGRYADCAINGGSGNTEYAGYFENAVISGGAGRGVFSGVFENMAIEAGAWADSFSGYFMGCAIQGGDGKNEFGGMFLGNSTTRGGGDDDNFHGRFIDSQVDAGEGANNFGRYLNLNAMQRIIAADGYEYQGLEADFVDSEVAGGEGDDTIRSVVWGGSITLGDGDNAASGVFSQSRVLSGNGNDTLTAVFSRETTFEAGAGDDSVNLATAFSSTVRTGEGTTAVLMGQNTARSSEEAAPIFEGDGYLRNSIWRTERQMRNNVPGKTYGELGGNSVDASAGENAFHVNDGAGTRSVWTGTREDARKNAEEKKRKDSAEPTELGRSLWEADQRLGFDAEGANPASADRTETAAERKRRRTALGRYARQSGDITDVTGSLGVSVTTGAGADIRIRTYDSANLDGPGKAPMHRIIRRSTGFGYYRWDAGRTLV